MDLVDFSSDVFHNIVKDFMSFADNLNFENVVPLPLSALQGDNAVERSRKTSWYTGPTLMGFLETVEVNEQQKHQTFQVSRSMGKPT